MARRGFSFNMKGFYIEITNNLLDPKHIEKMGSSVWLFMWLLDKMTSINEDGIGKVLGGKPVVYSEVKEDLGISERTYRRWTDTLREEKYITTIKAPYGLIFNVNKAKKRYARNVRSYATKGKSYADSGTSNIRHNKDYIQRHNLKKLKGIELAEFARGF